MADDAPMSIDAIVQQTTALSADIAAATADELRAAAAVVSGDTGEKRKRGGEKVVPERTLPALTVNNPALHVSHLHAKNLLKLLARIGSFGTTVRLDFHEMNGLSVQQVHSSGCILVELSVPVSEFAVYTMRTAAVSYAIKYEYLRKFLNMVRVDETLSFIDPDDGTSRLLARVHSTKSDGTRYFPTNNVSDLDMYVIPYAEYTYPVHVTLPSSELATIVNECKQAGAAFIELVVPPPVLDDEGKEKKMPPVIIVTAIEDTLSEKLAGTFERSIGVTTLVRQGKAVPQSFSMSLLFLVASLADVTSSVTLNFGNAEVPMHCQFTVNDTSASRIDVLVSSRYEQ